MPPPNTHTHTRVGLLSPFVFLKRVAEQVCLKELWIGSLTNTNFQNKTIQTTKFTIKSTKSTKITTRYLQILSLHEVFVLFSKIKARLF